MVARAPLKMTGAVPVLPAPVQRKAAMWAASQTLTRLPDADPDFQRQVLRELLYALGIVKRPDSGLVDAWPANPMPEEG
jgi:hypothetical protein